MPYTNTILVRDLQRLYRRSARNFFGDLPSTNRNKPHVHISAGIRNLTGVATIVHLTHSTNAGGRNNTTVTFSATNGYARFPARLNQWNVFVDHVNQYLIRTT